MITQLLILALAAAAVLLLIKLNAFSLAAPANPTSDLLTPAEGITQLWLALGSYIAMMFTGSIAASVITVTEQDNGQILLRTAIQFLGAAIGVFAVIFIAQYTLSQRRVRPPFINSTPRLLLGISIVPITLGAGTLAMLAANAIAHLTNAEQPSTIAHSSLQQFLDQGIADPSTIAAIAAVVLIAPALEEIIYRGMFQRAVAAMLGSTATAHWIAILTVSSIFTLMHAPVVPTHALPVIFTLSLGMGVAFAKSRSLAAPILAHIIFNATNILFAFITHTPQ